MLSDLNTLKSVLRIGTTDSSQDGYVVSLVVVADYIVKNWTHRNLEQTTVTEWYSGNGRPELPLREYPVQAVQGVWLDQGGFFGDGANAFGSNTLLTAGKDYVLKRGSRINPSWSDSGILRRLSGGTTGYLIEWPAQWRTGTLTAAMDPAWVEGVGNIQVAYTAGFGVGAPPPTAAQPLGGSLPGPGQNTIPPDLTMAVNLLATWLRQSTPVGIPITPGGPAAQKLMELLNQQTTTDPEVGTVRSILSTYRRLVI